MKLCVDVGNTTINMGFYENDSLVRRMLFDTLKDRDAYYYELCFLRDHSIDDVKDIMYISVVPSLDEVLIEALKKVYKTSNFHFIDDVTKFGINLQMENPNEIGGDLLADLVGAKYKYGISSLIIDLGTATKFLLLEDDVFIGCLIMPGMKPSLDLLTKKTDLLPEVDLSKPTASVLHTKNTKECIVDGVVYGHVSMIEGLINRFKRERNDEFMKVIFTGGDMNYIKPHLKDYSLLNNNVQEYYFDDSLVLDGELQMLNIIMERGK